MNIFILQFRRAGEDYQVQIFNTLQAAQEAAHSFLFDLWSSTVFNLSERDLDYPRKKTCENSDQLEVMEKECDRLELGYIEISQHQITGA